MKAIKNKFTVLAVVLSIMLTSCQSASESYLANFERFVDNVEKNASSYSKEDWNKSDATFSEFTGDRFEKVKDQLSYDEKKEVGRLVGRYYKTRLCASGEDVIGDLKSGIGFLSGLGDSLLEDVGTFENGVEE